MKSIDSNMLQGNHAPQEFHDKQYIYLIKINK